MTRKHSLRKYSTLGLVCAPPVTITRTRLPRTLLNSCIAACVMQARMVLQERERERERKREREREGERGEIEREQE
jgi:hypothetical protein